MNSGITVATVKIMCMKPLVVSTQHCFYVQKYAGHRENNCPLELHPEFCSCFLAHKVHLRYAISHFVEVLRYKPDDCGFDSRINNWICHWLNTPGHTMFLGSTQFLTEKSTTGKGRRCVGLTTLSHLLNVWKSWEPQTPGGLRACPGLYRSSFTYKFHLPHFSTDFSQLLWVAHTADKRTFTQLNKVILCLKEGTK